MNQLIFFLKTLDPCDNVQVLRVVLFIKTLLNITRFLLPIGLIVFITIDFVKNTYMAEEESMKKNLNLAIKRMILAVAGFLVPTIVNFAINTVLEANNLEKAKLNIDYQSCLDITSEGITAKIKEAKANCVGDDYEWNEETSLCIKKNTNPPANIVQSATKTITSNVSGGGVSNGKDFIYYNQGDYSNVGFCSGSTVKKAGCGAVSFSVVASSLVNSSYDPPTVAKWLCSNGHPGGGMEQGWFTRDSFLNKFGLKGEVLFDTQTYQGNSGKSYNSEYGNKILQAVQQGKGIVLYIPRHYVAVGPNSKCNSSEVYLYEVGARVKNGCYTPEKLFEITYNNKSRCSDKGNCGWHKAWAYTKA